MAERNLPHIVLNGVSKSESFRGKGGGGTPSPSFIQNRQAHAQQLIASLDAIQIEETARATYIAVQGRPGEPFLHEKFNVSGLSLLNMTDADTDQQVPGRAIVKASRSESGLSNLKGKLRQFAGDLRPPNNNGVRNPYHADMANSVGLFAEIELRDLWRHPTKPFPEAIGPIPWEVWLEPGEVEQFVARAVLEGLTVYPDRLEFPEDTVVLVEGDVGQMARTAIGTGSVRSISPPGAPIDFVDGIEAEDQADWLQNVLGRTLFGPQDQQAASYVTLLDTGITLAHP